MGWYHGVVGPFSSTARSIPSTTSNPAVSSARFTSPIVAISLSAGLTLISGGRAVVVVLMRLASGGRIWVVVVIGI